MSTRLGLFYAQELGNHIYCKFLWKSDLTDKMKRSFFQAAVTSILLYGRLKKRLEKKLDGNYTRMLRAILNKTPTVRPPAPYHENYSS